MVEVKSPNPSIHNAVFGKILGRNSRNPSCFLCVEPAHVPNEGICMARVLTRTSVGIHKNQPVGKTRFPLVVHS